MRESSSPLAPLRSKVLFCTGLDDGDSGFYYGLPCCNKLLYLCLMPRVGTLLGVANKGL